MLFVFAGVLVVGYASSQAPAPQAATDSSAAPADGTRAMLGNLLVVFSQLFTALQGGPGMVHISQDGAQSLADGMGCFVA